MKLLVVLLVQCFILGKPKIELKEDDDEYGENQKSFFIKFADKNNEASEICVVSSDGDANYELQGAYDFMSSKFLKIDIGKKIKLPKGSIVTMKGDVNSKIDSTTTSVTFLTEVTLVDGIYTVSLEDMLPDPVSYLCLVAKGSIDAQTNVKTYSIEVSQIDRNGNILSKSIKEGDKSFVNVFNSTVDLKVGEEFAFIVKGEKPITYTLNQEKGFRTCLKKNGTSDAKIQKSKTGFTIEFLPRSSDLI